MVMKIVKRVSVPVLLIASIFSRYAGRYEFLLDSAICLGALVLIQQAVRLRQYFLAAGFVTVAVVFSPFALVVKIFLLMGLAGIASVVTLVAIFRKQAFFRTPAAFRTLSAFPTPPLQAE